MSDAARKDHWEQVYATKAEREVSWFQDDPAPSLDLIAAALLPAGAAVIDIGGGASRLVDALIARGIGPISVLDLSASALAAASRRLGARGADVDWVAADVTAWEPSRTYELWHDRAAFHFLTDPGDQAAYVARVKRAVGSGGHVIIGTFAPDGPETCSGLPVVRHDAASLARLLGDEFELRETRRHDHATPWGAVQRFQFGMFRRR